MDKVPKVLLFLENSRQYGRDLIQGIMHYSKSHGPWTFYHDDTFYSQKKGRRKNLSWIKKWGANGIITRDSQDMDKFRALGLPIISASAFLERSKNIIEIVTDDESIGQLACEHFINRGFTNFAFCGFKDMPWSMRRQKSFINILREKGYNTTIYNSNSSRMLNWEKEHPRIIKWLESLPKPVGILCCNDDRGCDLIEVCKAGGFEVPFEVAILGVDNDVQVCELSNPPLSSISLSTEQAGYQAAETLDKLMSGKAIDITEINVLPLDIVNRQSTDTLAIKDSQVVKALQFIKQNAQKLIQVSDVVDHVKCSRRNLDEKFTKYLRHTIFAEIRRVRVETIAKMLLETDLSIFQIAMKLGYKDSNHIARFFKQEKKMTPQSYKKIHVKS